MLWCSKLDCAVSRVTSARQSTGRAGPAYGTRFILRMHVKAKSGGEGRGGGEGEKEGGGGEREGEGLRNA